MACALCISNAPRRVVFPPRMIGFCRLNSILSAKLTSFFVTTVLEPPDLAGYKIKTPTNSGIMPSMKYCEGIADKLSGPADMELLVAQ